jgi:Tfp pilus assembly major pilin PilA
MAALIHTEGLQFMLEVCFTKQQTVPTNYYIGLATDALLVDTDTLSTLTEVTGTGYARQAVASGATDFTSASTGTNDRKITTKSVTFTATASDWTGAKTVFLCTVTSGTSGKLIQYAPLSATRTLANGDTLTVALEIDSIG